MIAGRIPSANNAIQRILERLSTIEAALKDINDPMVTRPTRDYSQTSEFQHRLRNRIMAAVLSLRHLEDDARRLLRKLQRSPQDVSVFIQSSIPLRVLKRLADSTKHGLGGREPDGAILNGMLTVEEARPAEDLPDPNERIHVIAMNVADSADGTFPSSTLINAAIQDWGTFLKPFMPQADDWVRRCIPATNLPVVRLKGGTTQAVPLGAVLEVELPVSFRDMLQKETKRRITDE